MAHHHKRPVKYHRHRVLDPNPAPSQRGALQTFELALQELRTVGGNVFVMTQFRGLLPAFILPQLVTDDHVLQYLAHQVGLGSMAIRLATLGGDLPWAQIIADLKRFEGVVPHMYVDTKGYVTVGVGKMLPNAVEAQKLGFVVRATGAKATPEQIAADFAKVAAQPKGQLWQKYTSDLDLPPAEIDRLVREIAERCDQEVADRYKGYTGYPVEVRRVLIDMRFNMGGNMDKFKNFKKSVEQAATSHGATDWTNAAKESYRRDVGQDRNDWASDMILKGGGVKK